MAENIEQLVSELRRRQETITSAESFTGGLFAENITAVPGASYIFPGAVVTYATKMKTKILDVSPALIRKYGVVSGPVAEAMALAAQRLYESDWAVSFTGAAGPDPLEGHPAGTTYIGIARPDGKVTSYLNVFTGGRKEVREQAITFATKQLLATLAK